MRSERDAQFAVSVSQQALASADEGYRVRRELFRDDAALALTLREFDLLHFLVRHAGQAFSRGELLSRVWGAGFDGYEHTVNSHINRLRAKVEDDPREPRRIVTVWGVGYRFEIDAA